MRLQQHIKDKESMQILLELIYFLERGDELNEKIGDKAFDKIKSIGRKLGLKINRSETLFGYLKDAGSTFDELCRVLALYVYTDVTDRKTRKMLVGMAKKELKSINKRKVAGFIFQLEKSTLGISGIFRRILQATLGIEISAYNNWSTDIDYLKKELDQSADVLRRMGAEDELGKLNKYRNDMLKRLEKTGGK